MIRTLVVGLLCLGFAAATAAAVDEPYRPVPMITAVDASTVKAGAALTAIGTHLEKASVAGLYMIQGDKTIEVKIINQTDEVIRFTVPASTKPGRFQLMVLTTGTTPQFLEEPVFFTVE